MDTLTWQYPLPHERNATLGVSAPPAPVALAGGTNLLPTPTDPQLPSNLGMPVPGRDVLVRHGALDEESGSEVPGEGQVLSQDSGQPPWHQPPVLWNDSPVSLPAVVPTMSAPMINVSMATPVPQESDISTSLPFSSDEAKGQGYPFYTSDSQSSMTGSPVAGSNSDTSQSGWEPVMYPNDPAATMGPISLHQNHRQPHNEHFKGLLKLDVNMGFTGDCKMESPTTMLHPVGPGWKKRRSASDVGPRTPSLLGPTVDAFTSPIDDLSYLIQSMGGKTSPREMTAPSMASTASAPGINFESLTLQAEESSPSLQAPLSPSLKRDANSTDPTFASCNIGVPSQEMTLNPSLIQTPSNDMVRKSVMQVFQEPGIYADAQEENLTGPVRHGSKSPRPLSPYHASTRSVTPESEHSFDNSIQNEAAVRMMQWRFPLSGSHQSLHPMDAYGPALHQGVRFPSTSRNPRRHLRTSVSEDFQGRTKHGSLFPVANSMDLRQHELPFLSPLQRHQASSMSSDMVKCQSSPGRQVSQEVPSTTGVSLSSLEEYNTLVDTQVEPDSSPRNANQSSNRHSPRENSETSFHSASQTRTPVVTTSASQAASASRRKAEALYTCPFPDCGSTFTRQYNLRGHLRSHLDERPFKCEWPGCGRSFARVHDCKRHHNLHLNIKPYQCEGCQKTFARLDALNRHYKSEASTCGIKAADKLTKPS